METFTFFELPIALKIVKPTNYKAKSFLPFIVHFCFCVPEYDNKTIHTTVQSFKKLKLTNLFCVFTSLIKKLKLANPMQHCQVLEMFCNSQLIR